MNTFQSTYCTMYIQSSLERSLLWFIHSEATYQLSVGNLQMHNYKVQKSKILFPLNFNINMLIPFLKINNKILPVLEEWWKYGWQVITPSPTLKSLLWNINNGCIDSNVTLGMHAFVYGWDCPGRISKVTLNLRHFGACHFFQLWCPFVGTFYVESMVSIKSKTLIQSTRKVPTNELKKVTNFGGNIHLKTFQPYL